MAEGEGHPEVRLLPRGARRVRAGHPWVFRDDVGGSSAGHGDVVRVLAPSGETLGHAFHSTRSKIALRMVRRGDEAPDGAFWGRVLDAAIALRREAGLAGARADGTACRLVFGESDGVPGLVADAYDGHVVVQALTASVERLLGVFLDLLADRIEVRSVLARNDPAVRALEGLPREVRAIRGNPPESVTVLEAGVRLRVDLRRGQKTGMFLDQRDNRVALGAVARGRVLDAFCYQGAFGLHAAKHAERVVMLDASAEALAAARENAAANGFENVETVEANVFDDLRERARRGETFHTVVLDPPAFAKSRKDLPAALRGYKEINLRAMRLVDPGGMLVTSSCSYNLDEPAFEGVLADAAADAGAAFRIAERRGQSADHPVRLGFPESRYLKCLVLRRSEDLA